MTPCDAPRAAPETLTTALSSPCDPRNRTAAAPPNAGPRDTGALAASVPDPVRPADSARAAPVAVTAHLLLIDQTGRILLRQAANGLWGLPATALHFDAPPQHYLALFAGRDLGIKVAARDLLLAHVSAHRTAAHAAIRLVFSVSLDQPHCGPAHSARPQRASPGRPPGRLAPWDAETLPRLLTVTPYTETGWDRPATPIPRTSS